ncbi:hypothetical protein F0562_035391 [Nyssa sinensis]|uniref:C2H2-type domain-containing protein n=1 Tax=Nyssa sinensis TaxID=561372 RepID=A0A5J5AB21_9ASTE|nr:hypothetical protein F0562_035391 [Nyssa sinensis]
MERNDLSNNLKDHSLGRRTMKDDNNNKKVSDSWDSTSESHGGGGGDLLGGFLWPPRSYTCSFCKREFRSAQALGGHMNVHRRERARLRQSPPRDGQYPFLNLNLNLNLNHNHNHKPNPTPNCNPNFSSSSPSSSPSVRFPPFTSTLPPLVSPVSSLSLTSSASATETKTWSVDNACGDCLSKGVADLTKIKTSKALFGVGEFKGFTGEGECKVLEKADIVKLDLEFGLLSDSKEDLDLELRL